MNRCSFCEWIPILPWPVWPLAGHARLGQNTVVGSMTILLSWLCWGACQEEVCLDPRFLCNLTLPRLGVELPNKSILLIPCMCGELTQDLVAEALSTVSVQDVTTWVSENVGETMQSMRRREFPRSQPP